MHENKYIQGVKRDSATPQILDEGRIIITLQRGEEPGGANNNTTTTTTTNEQVSLYGRGEYGTSATTTGRALGHLGGMEMMQRLSAYESMRRPLGKFYNVLGWLRGKSIDLDPGRRRGGASKLLEEITMNR
ncbi:hypothetical protein AC578_10549 [Pseudocercospora eumusae]|uniref:Uncharacterized protein n=1 Tax=Pseudocercospora eumusae TaxID=321146 RepID=A0A139H5R5_9PEZI|nr:hypothetical protein AC578_10549 [Pseudocercospora eumusae]